MEQRSSKETCTNKKIADRWRPNKETVLLLFIKGITYRHFDENPKIRLKNQAVYSIPC